MRRANTRHGIHKVTNWPAYEVALPQRAASRFGSSMRRWRHMGSGQACASREVAVLDCEKAHECRAGRADSVEAGTEYAVELETRTRRPISDPK